MKFESKEQVTTYFNSVRSNWTGHPMGLRYSIEAKKASVEFKSENDLTNRQMADLTGVNSFPKWVSEHREGLYEDFSGLVGVSRVVKKAHSQAVLKLMEKRKELVDRHKADLLDITVQIKKIEELESMGFTVTKAA